MNNNLRKSVERKYNLHMKYLRSKAWQDYRAYVEQRKCVWETDKKSKKGT